MAQRLPRHVIGAISVAIGFFGGIAMLLILPQKFGVSPKLTGFMALAVWIASTWVFWTGGKEKKGETETAPPPPAGES
ncbi:hypothetical protein A6A04_08895 [Paramagnetospirillum marisnigri]|uniref:Uncharacterized protein n=1 Tax=Paramagnetospirillum marisnigri TaxID=1285242 RepID=A0A178M5E9_9PROT|nr:hypothetical protein [Paramagnetospirillum marisnigri]OAN43989.1 hypothetical protein A6A04_08895 [Paramagnetospirillum marisnigri]